MGETLPFCLQLQEEKDGRCIPNMIIICESIQHQVPRLTRIVREHESQQQMNVFDSPTSS